MARHRLRLWALLSGAVALRVADAFSFSLDDVSSAFGPDDAGKRKFASGAAVGDKVVFAPWELRRAAAVYDVSSGDFSLVDIAGQLTGSNHFFFGAVTMGDRVIFGPCGEKKILIFDVASNTYTFFDLTGRADVVDFAFCGVGAVGDVVVFPPYNGNHLGLYHPETAHFETLDVSGQVGSTPQRFLNTAAVIGDKAYFAPYSDPRVAVYDAILKSFSLVDLPGDQLATLGASASLYACAVAVRGKVVFCPYHANAVGILDPTDSSWHFLSIQHIETVDRKTYAGAAVGHLVVMAPNHAENIIILDTNTNSISTVDSQLSSTYKFGSAVVVGSVVVMAPENPVPEVVGLFDTGLPVTTTSVTATTSATSVTATTTVTTTAISTMTTTATTSTSTATATTSAATTATTSILTATATTSTLTFTATATAAAQKQCLRVDMAKIKRLGLIPCQESTR